MKAWDQRLRFSGPSSSNSLSMNLGRGLIFFSAYLGAAGASLGGGGGTYYSCSPESSQSSQQSPLSCSSSWIRATRVAILWRGILLSLRICGCSRQSWRAASSGSGLRTTFCRRMVQTFFLVSLARCLQWMPMMGGSKRTHNPRQTIPLSLIQFKYSHDKTPPPIQAGIQKVLSSVANWESLNWLSNVSCLAQVALSLSLMAVIPLLNFDYCQKLPRYSFYLRISQASLRMRVGILFRFLIWDQFSATARAFFSSMGGERSTQCAVTALSLSGLFLIECIRAQCSFLGKNSCLTSLAGNCRALSSPTNPFPSFCRACFFRKFSTSLRLILLRTPISCMSMAFLRMDLSTSLGSKICLVESGFLIGSSCCYWYRCERGFLLTISSFGREI